MTARVILLWHVYVTSLTTSMSTMHSHISTTGNIHFEGDEIPFLRVIDDEQNLTLVVISYEIYGTRQWLVS